MQYVRRHNRTEYKCDVTIENLRRQTFTVVFWGQQAKKFDAKAIINMPAPVLAVFTGLKLAPFRNRVVGNTTNHTCLLLNPLLAVTDAYRTEFSRPGDKTEITGPFLNFEDKQEQEIITVQQLTGRNPRDFMTKSLYCKGQILKFGCDGWWYRACPVENCYKQCFKKEENDDKYSCNTHEPGTPIPTYRVGVILDDVFSDVTVTLMGNIAEQFFGYKLDVLRNKRVYVSEQVIPPEIAVTAGQVRTFEVKGNTHGNWKVIGFSPPEETPTVTVHATKVSEKQTSASSTIIPALTLQTPEKSVGGKQKRGANLISPALRGSTSEKKPRRNEEEDAASSSPNITEKHRLD